MQKHLPGDKRKIKDEWERKRRGKREENMLREGEIERRKKEQNISWEVTKNGKVRGGREKRKTRRKHVCNKERVYKK